MRIACAFIILLGCLLLCCAVPVCSTVLVHRVCSLCSFVAFIHVDIFFRLCYSLCSAMLCFSFGRSCVRSIHSIFTCYWSSRYTLIKVANITNEKSATIQWANEKFTPICCCCCGHFSFCSVFHIDVNEDSPWAWSSARKPIEKTEMKNTREKDTQRTLYGHYGSIGLQYFNRSLMVEQTVIRRGESLWLDSSSGEWRNCGEPCTA